MSTLTEEELREIVEVVWMTVLELPVDAADEQELAATSYLTSVIEITGAWEGFVSVRASIEFLEHASSLMFSIDVNDVQDVDCRDSLTELTNMLGGTVKCLLPEICDLSLPSIRSEQPEDGSQKEWVNFNCEDHPFSVAVIERAAEASNAA